MGRGSHGSSRDQGAAGVEGRVAALEAHLARLEARFASPPECDRALSSPRAPAPGTDARSHAEPLAGLDDQASESGPTVDRRGLLRRGGFVLAGAAGAVALPQLTACGDGTNFVLGRANTTQSPTTLDRTQSSGAPTLILGSSAAAASNPQLRLAPLNAGPPAASKPGDLFVQAGTGGFPTLLFFTHEPKQGPVAAAIGTVYTDFLANLFVPISQEAVPGGYPGPRAFSATVTSVAAATVDLSRFVAPGGLVVAVVATLSVAAPTGAGLATVYDPATANPGTPHVRWPAGGATSGLVVAVPGQSGAGLNTLKVAITAGAGSVSANVTVDIAGFFVPSPANLAANALAPSLAGASGAARHATPRTFGRSSTRRPEGQG